MIPSHSCERRNDPSEFTRIFRSLEQFTFELDIFTGLTTKYGNTSVVLFMHESTEQSTRRGAISVSNCTRETINGLDTRVAGALLDLPIATLLTSNGGVLGILTLYGVQISFTQRHCSVDDSDQMKFANQTHMEPLGRRITLAIDFKWLRRVQVVTRGIERFVVQVSP